MNFQKLIFIFLLSIASSPLLPQDSTRYIGKENSIYQFKVKDIDGKEFDIACLEGEKILIIITASKCMYRHQLADLQDLYEKYKDRNFIILAFPTNDFFYREPKGNFWIKKHYKKKYNIGFPIMSKVYVKGNKTEPIFDFLSYKIKNGKFDAPPKWNFQKYLIDRQGFVYKSVSPSTNPFDKEITDWIESEKEE